MAKIFPILLFLKKGDETRAGPSGERDAVRRWASRKKGVRIFDAVEHPQIVGGLADADKADRDLKLPGDADDDAALRRPVEFRKHDARHPDGIVEHPGLGQGVLSRRGVEHQEDFVRGAGQFAEPLTDASEPWFFSVRL